MGFRASWLASSREVVRDLANEMGEAHPADEAEDVGVYELRRRDGAVLLASGGDDMDRIDRALAQQASAGGEVVWWRGDEGDMAAQVAVFAEGQELWAVAYDEAIARSGAVPAWAEELLDRAQAEAATVPHDACFEAVVVLGEKLAGLRFDEVERTPWVERRAFELPKQGPPPGTFAECPGAWMRAWVAPGYRCEYSAHVLAGAHILNLMVTVKRTSGISIVQREVEASGVVVELTPDVEWLEAVLLFSGGRHGSGSLKLQTDLADFR
ncbi:MAG: hypothetical protein R3F61_08710 [Myxococcota bacterium]